jgi:hypothetical protein
MSAVDAHAVTSGARLSMALVLLAGLSACGSSMKSTITPTTPTTPTTAAPTSTTAPSAVASATIELTGAIGLAGPASEQGVRCNFPDLAGLSIAVLAVPPDGTSLARIAFWPGRVRVIISAGDGADFHERAFEGTSVTAFDAARRAIVDTKLTEVAATTGPTKGDIGVITAIKGSVECGDQTPGESTVTLTGATPEGALTGAGLDPVRVECDPSPDGPEVASSGVVQIGATKAIVAIGLTSDGAVSVDETLPTTHHRYTAAGTATVTAHGAHVRADVVDKTAPASASRLHVEGDFTCGRNAAG